MEQDRRRAKKARERKAEENQQPRNVTGNSVDTDTSAEARKSAYSQSRPERPDNNEAGYFGERFYFRE
jgi:hypothetical protein